MKRTLSLILALLLLITAAGCSAGKEGGPTEPDSFARRETYADNAYEPIPSGYIEWLEDCGTVVDFNYIAKTEDGVEYEKHSFVYLPKGYDANDKDRKYNVIYLMHGGGDDETWYFADTARMSQARRFFDSMMEADDIVPCIICTPTYNIPGYEGDSTEAFAYELKNYLIPALEGEFNTYAEDTTPEGLKASRWNRAFVGFSMGAATTWNVFANCLDEIAYYIPVSGGFRGGDSTEESAQILEQSVIDAGYTWEDFVIYAVCGGESDLAYSSMNEFIDALKKHSDTFIFCDNFADGNFYYTQVDGGHAIYSVFNGMYNALPKFFGY